MAILVVSRQRNQVEGLGEIGARSDGAALLGLQLGHMLAELGVHHGDLSVLHNEALDALHGLLGVVRHLDGGSRLLAMIVDLPVQRNLQTDLAIREGESLADQRAGQTLATIEGSVLQLLDHQTDHAPLVLAIVLGVAHKCPDGVLDAQGLAIVVALLLQSNGAGRIGREVEGERIGVAAQFADLKVKSLGYLAYTKIVYFGKRIVNIWSLELPLTVRAGHIQFWLILIGGTHILAACCFLQGVESLRCDL